MSIVSLANQAHKFQSADVAQIERASWALRQRLRKQMNQLSGSFFDEVDDFVFEAGKQGQLSSNSDYLGAMREIRAKQVLFEETLLDLAREKLEKGYSDSDDFASQNSSESPVIFESMEIELAIDTMARKASKYYLPYAKQIDSLSAAIQTQNGKFLIGGNSLVTSVLLGFAQAQSSININLEIRLLFMKLFEQHFLLKMEKLYLDVIGIMNNIDNKQFVERLYSSSSSFHIPVAKSCTHTNDARQDPLSDFKQLKPDSREVESAVAEVMQVAKAAELPGFVLQMIESHWRMVLKLIGLNKGVSSLEWQEAEHVLRLLVLCSSAQIETGDFDESLLIDKIRQGLRLLRVVSSEEEHFVAALKECFSTQAEKFSSAAFGDEVSAPIQAEATVSPSGKSILDAADLNEIAQLINGEPINNDYAENEDKALLLDCLASVDRMSACCSAQMFVKGKPHACVITRNGTDNGVFIITSASSDTTSRKIAITRSRLGLAISIRCGELSLSESMRNTAESNITVFERKS